MKTIFLKWLDWEVTVSDGIITNLGWSKYNQIHILFLEKNIRASSLMLEAIDIMPL